VLIGAYGSSPRVPAAQTARRLRPCGERGRPEVCRARCSTVISTPFRDGRAPPAGSSPADRCVERQPSGDHGLCECQGGESLGDGADLERSIGARSRAAGRPQPADARNKRPHHPARRGWPSQLRHGRGRAHRLSAGRAGFALPAGRLSRPPVFSVHRLFGHTEYRCDFGPGPAGYPGAAYHPSFQAASGATQFGRCAQCCPRILVAGCQRVWPPAPPPRPRLHVRQP
jgi:hypothetical protein